MKTILFIEDDKDLQESFKVFCQSKGYKLYCASNGEAGIQYAVTARPDVIVLDMLLPGVDGAEVCRRIKKNEKTMQIPVILYTGVRTSMGIDIDSRDYRWIPADKIVDKCDGYNCLHKAVSEFISKK